MKNILLAINDAYMDPVKVCLSSLFDTNKADEYRVVIFESSLSDSNKKELTEYIRGRRSEVYFEHIGWRSFSKAPKRENISIETYYRLLAFHILQDTDKILYLDADTLVTGDISDLFGLEMDSFCIAGVEDQGLVKGDYYHKTKLGIGRNGIYINGGVVLMNLERIRRAISIDDVFDCIYEHGLQLKYQDQDVLNILFNKETYLLPEEYNMIPAYVSAGEVISCTISEVLGREKLPKIIHYMGMAYKPWRDGGYGYRYFMKYYVQCRKVGCDELFRKIKRNAKRRVLSLVLQYIEERVRVR